MQIDNNIKDTSGNIKVQESNVQNLTDKINQINDGNEDFFWKKARIDEEIERIKAYERSLKQGRKDEDEHTITY